MAGAVGPEVRPGPHVDIRRAADRFATDAGGVRSRHCFSFGRHYDPANTSHGVLVASNDDVVEPGAGFDPHPHRDLEIVTWVLRGLLVHEDSTGRRGVVRPGVVQRMSAGTGVLHSERNDGPGPVRLVQMWVPADTVGTDPDYADADVDAALRTGELVPVASGMERHDAALRIRRSDAALHAAQLRPRQAVLLPDAPFLHLYLALGVAELDGHGTLEEGDAVRVTGTGGHRLTATAPLEVLVWEMHSSLP